MTRRISLGVEQKLFNYLGVAPVCCAHCREKSTQNQQSSIPEEPLISVRKHQKQPFTHARCHVPPFKKKVFHRTTEWLVHYCFATNCNGKAYRVIQMILICIPSYLLGLSQRAGEVA
ncbi:MAG TPA: hypothetical protein DCW57_08935 [Planctomycetaceae bacterium]|nr:hypothetical protein [Planctomycetaceae bacterium]